MVAVVWIRELDYLRGFSALAVIAVHVSMSAIQIPAADLLCLPNVFVYIIAHFAVPVFIFISGWVLALRYTGAYSVPAYYQRRARTILPSYLFFTGFFLLVSVEGAVHLAGVPDPGAAASALLMGTAAYHLWFFVLIIQFYLLYPLIVGGYDAFDRAGAALYLLLALLFGQVLWNVGAHVFGAFAGADWYTVLIRLFPSHLFYFVLGIHVARHTDRFRSALRSFSPVWVLIAVALGALLLGGIWVAAVLRYGSFSGATLAVFCIYRILEPLYYVPVIAVLILAARRLEATAGPLSDALRSFGEHSFGIYLIHPLIIAACTGVWASFTGLSWADWPTYPVLFVATAVVSYGVVRFAAPLPYVGRLSGSKRSDGT